MRNPSVQFLFALVATPLYAIFGEAISMFWEPFALLGWLVTFTLLSITARRSYRYERALLPDGKLLSLLPAHSPMARYLVGVRLLSIFFTIAAFFVAAALAVLFISTWAEF